MNKLQSRSYLYIAAGGILLIGLLMAFYLFSTVSKSETVEYVYIDNDDTQDSVISKIQVFSHTAGMTGLNALIRHSGYGQHIRTGRYAVNPGEHALTVFRRLRSGQQASMHLIIPEMRTMDRLAAFLSKKLMLDSASIARSLTDPSVCQRLGYDTCTIPALFVPNTYDVYWDTSLDALLDLDAEEKEGPCASNPEDNERLVFERNANWVKAMPDIMRQAPTFFAVGAAHLCGDRGVLRMLEKEGYKVEGVK